MGRIAIIGGVGVIHRAGTPAPPEAAVSPFDPQKRVGVCTEY